MPELNHDREHLRSLLSGALKINAGDAMHMEGALTLRRLDKGDRLLVPGEICTLEGIVTKGCLRVYFTESDGSERVLYFAAEGWCVTDMESFTSDRATGLGIDALEPTSVWVLDKASRNSAQSNVATCDRIRRVLAETALIAFQRRLVGGMRKSAARRYLEFRQLYPGLDLRIPQYHIAAYLGISPEFLSKLRKRLIRDEYRLAPS